MIYLLKKSLKKVNRDNIFDVFIVARIFEDFVLIPRTQHVL